MHQGLDQGFFIPVKSWDSGHIEVAEIEIVHTFDVGIHLTSVVMSEGGHCFDIDVAFPEVDWDLS